MDSEVRAELSRVWEEIRRVKIELLQLRIKTTKRTVEDNLGEV